MCNAYEQDVKWVEYVAMMQKLELGIPTEQTELDLPQSAEIRIDQMGPVMRARDDLVELAPMNFGLPSDQPKRGPIFNYRSDGRSFAKSRRCLIANRRFYATARYLEEQRCQLATPFRTFNSSVPNSTSGRSERRGLKHWSASQTMLNINGLL